MGAEPSKAREAGEVECRRRRLGAKTVIGRRSGGRAAARAFRSSARWWLVNRRSRLGPHTQEAGDGALAGGENGADRQQLGMVPDSRLSGHRDEGWQNGGETGWLVRGGISWWRRANLPPTCFATSPAPLRRARPQWPKSS